MNLIEIKIKNIFVYQMCDGEHFSWNGYKQ